MTRLPGNVKLLMAGTGGAASSRPPEFYRQLAGELGVRRRCAWDLRRIPEEEVGDLFAACDCVLLTYSARFRSASGVLSTAVAARKPVLASSGEGPLKKAIRGYGLGVWVEPDSVDALVGGFEKLQTDPPRPDWEGYLRDHSWKRNAEVVGRELFGASPA